jgi:hypothetical protein
MRRILAAPLAAGLVLGGTAVSAPALAQSANDTDDQSDVRASVQVDEEISSFFEKEQEREQRRFEQFFQREREQRSGDELQALNDFREFFESSQERENEQFSAAMATAQLTISNAFADELSNEFPQVTRGLSDDRLVRLSERVCITLRDGEVPGLGAERASENSVVGREDDADGEAETQTETETETETETKADAEAEEEARGSGEAQRDAQTSAQTEAQALVQIVLDTGKRTSAQVVDFIEQEACDAGTQASASADAGADANNDNADRNKNDNNTDDAAQTTADVAAQLSAQFKEETRGLSEERLNTFVDDVRESLEQGDIAGAMTEVQASLDVARDTAEEITTSISESLGL